MVSRILIITLTTALFFVNSSWASEISIGRINNAKSGERKTVTISADDIASQISSFNLCIAFDQSLSYVLSAKQGKLHEDHNWEYFTYRTITKDSVNAHFPGSNVHLINIIGIASLSSNAPETISGTSFVLAELDVLLATITGSFSDDTWTPFNFFWRDCNDNVLTSVDGNTILTANQLFENRSASEPHNPISFPFPGFGVPDNPCPPPHNETVESTVDFVNSGISAFVFDPTEECFNGDVNLNGIHYEVSDLVLFVNYFIYGMAVLPWPPQESIAQTDCNCDNVAISVADVICFIRTVNGEMNPGKIAIGPISPAVLSLTGSNVKGGLTLSSESDIALVYLRIRSFGGAPLKIRDFDFGSNSPRTGQIGNDLTAMIVDLDGCSIMSTGANKIFDYNGNTPVEIDAWVVDMAGNESSFKLENSVLPESPELLQNYPNPFNPSTTIEFNLPANADWGLEIYNVSGQIIRGYQGKSAGLTKLEWDGTSSNGVSVASGVYFYKLISGDISLSRKMLLIK